MTTELSQWEKSLAKHAMTLAFEGDDVEVNVDSDVEWHCAAEKWTVETFDVDGSEAVVHATYDTYVSVKVSSGSRMQPPEYENHDVELHMVVRFDPEANCGLGHASATIEQEGGLPEPHVEYDPMEHKYNE